MSPVKAGSEAAFQTQVLNLAELYGWRCYHTHDSRRSQRGFPDLVLVRGPELIFAELKTDTGRVRREQAEWIHDLQNVSSAVSFARDVALQQPDDKLPDCVRVDRGVAIDVYLWRPADFDELHARLARGRHQLKPLYREDTAA